MVYITFFHNSSEYREEFSSKEPSRPCFYWFGDSYHCHLGWNVRDDYFYLFVKNPKRDKIFFRSRSKDLGFNGLYSNFLEYRAERKKIYSGQEKYTEPSILMSFSKIRPNIIAKYIKDAKEFEIIKPESYRGTKFSVNDENARLIPFNEIKEVVNIVPEIKNSYPFVAPEKKLNKYFYEDWLPMITEKNGVWL